jgi:hypothetical protein
MRKQAELISLQELLIEALENKTKYNGKFLVSE